MKTKTKTTKAEGIRCRGGCPFPLDYSIFRNKTQRKNWGGNPTDSSVEPEQKK